MSVKIFVNLPVADVAKSIEFFAALGFAHNPKFTDDESACVVFSDSVYAMLLTESRFTAVVNREVADTRTSAEAVVALGLDSREQVDDIADKALAAGGRSTKDPEDHGFMYGRNFVDPDGHLWELFWMDEAAAQS